MNSKNFKPTKDGDITPYLGTLAEKFQGWQSRQAIFVNGMNNSPDNHLDSSKSVSDTIGGTVIGVYNMMAPKRGGSFIDYIRKQRQSIPDWADKMEPLCKTNNSSKIKDQLSFEMAGAMARDSACALTVIPVTLLAVGHDLIVKPGTRAILSAIESLLLGINITETTSVVGDVAQCGLDILNLVTLKFTGTAVMELANRYPEAFRNIIFGYFRSVNPAVGALLDLIGTQPWPTSRCGIVCHSQGNLITSCALSALECLNAGSCRPSNLKGVMQVFSVASPAFRWPRCGAQIMSFNHKGDKVAWLGAVGVGRAVGAVGRAVNPGAPVFDSQVTRIVEPGSEHALTSYMTPNSQLPKVLRQWYGLKP